MAPLPAPVLDARTPEELTRQARSLLERYSRGADGAPGWVAPEPGGELDPAAAVLGVFAHFASRVAARLNQMPELHHRAFLDAVGLPLRGPAAAQAALIFTPSAGTGEGLVPRGTRVSPQGRPELAFETLSDLTLSHARVDRALVMEPSADRSHDVTLGAGGCAPFLAFTGVRPIERALYLRADGLLDHPRARAVSVSLTGGGAPGLYALPLEWARWDGGCWRPLGRSAGIQQGLEVELPQSGSVVTVGPGWALDRSGRTVELGATRELDLSLLLAASPESEGEHALAIWMAWGEAGPRFRAHFERELAQPDPGEWLCIARLLAQGGGALESLRHGQSTRLSEGALTWRLESPPRSQPTQLAQRQGCWLRISPARSAAAEGYALSRASIHVEGVASGLAPAALRFNAAVLDPGAPWAPFGARPEPGDRFTLVEGEALRQLPGTTVTLELSLASHLTPGDVVASPDLILVWELSTSSGWTEIGRSSPAQVNLSAAPGFEDSSRGLTTWQARGSAYTTSLRFTLPAGVAPTRVGSEVGCALRARIAQGDYGTTGHVEQVIVQPSSSNSSYYASLPEDGQGNKVTTRWVLDSFAPPILAGARLAYDTTPSAPVPPSSALRVERFEATEQGPALASGEGLRIFTAAEGDEAPALHLGLDRSPGNVALSWYVRTADRVGEGATRRAGEEPPRLEWSVSTAQGWEEIAVEDGTRQLRQRGVLRWVAPLSMAPARVGGVERWWLRARWIGGDYPWPPALAGVWSCAVMAEHSSERTDVVGVGADQPSQRLRAPQPPLLPGARVEVEEAPGRWEPWEVVVDLRTSLGGERHVAICDATGELTFGDGQRGRMAPRGARIRVTARRGGGEVGDLPAGSLERLTRPLAGVQAVTQVDPARGGVDVEGQSARQQRGAAALRHRDRAVTAADFEDLARALSPQVARALAIPLIYDPLALAETREMPSGAGRVEVLLVPRRSEARPTPDAGLLLAVEEGLRARAQAGMEVYCRPPGWIDVHVAAVISAHAQADAPSLRAALLARLRAWLHPLTGGPAGEGWPFGRLPHHSDLHAVLLATPGVRHVRSLKLTLGGALDACATAVSDAEIEALSAAHRALLSGCLVASGEHTLTLVGA